MDTAKKHHIGQVRRILQRCASIAGAHSVQAAVDIRRAFRVEPELGPRRIYISGGTPEIPEETIALKVFARGEIPVCTLPYALPGTDEDFTANYSIPLLLGCDGVAMVPGWKLSPRAVKEHAAAVRHSIPITYEKI